MVLVFGISFAAYGFSLRVLHWGFTIAAACVAILGGLAIFAVGGCDPGVFPRSVALLVLCVGFLATFVVFGVRL